GGKPPFIARAVTRFDQRKSTWARVTPRFCRAPLLQTIQLSNLQLATTKISKLSKCSFLIFLFFLFSILKKFARVRPRPTTHLWLTALACSVKPQQPRTSLCPTRNRRYNHPYKRGVQ